MRKGGIIFIIVLVVLAGIVVWKNRSVELPMASELHDPSRVTLTLGDGRVVARVASTSDDRARGLSGTKSLSDTEGMLFVFKEVGSYGFWMKDMLMPIDIIWLSKDREVVFVAPNVPPESYPQVFGTKTRAQYVLEVRAGWVQDMRVKVGDKAQW